MLPFSDSSGQEYSLIREVLLLGVNSMALGPHPGPWAPPSHLLNYQSFSIRNGPQSELSGFSSLLPTHRNLGAQGPLLILNCVCFLLAQACIILFKIL